MPPFERITVDPEILAGKPVIRGTRLAVEFILEQLAAGQPSGQPDLHLAKSPMKSGLRRSSYPLLAWISHRGQVAKMPLSPAEATT